MRLTTYPPRRPRNHLGRGGYKLTVLKLSGKWHVLYVAEVDRNHVVWSVALPGVTTNSWAKAPFDTWRQAMDYAATLRTYYGDQCRGDLLIWTRFHGEVAHP